MKAQDDRLFYLYEAIKRGYSIEKLAEMTKIHIFFLDKLLHIYEIAEALRKGLTSDLYGLPNETVFRTKTLLNYGIKPQMKFVICELKTTLFQFTKWLILCAGEFESETPYFYSTYELENESVKTDQESVLVLVQVQLELDKGRIDYATVHSVEAIKRLIIHYYE